MEHDGAVGRPAHARVGDAHHVRDALAASTLGGRAHVSDFRHARITFWPAILQHQDRMFRPHRDRDLRSAAL